VTCLSAAVVVLPALMLVLVRRREEAPDRALGRRQRSDVGPATSESLPA